MFGKINYGKKVILIVKLCRLSRTTCNAAADHQGAADHRLKTHALGHQTDQRGQTHGPSGGPFLADPTLVFRVDTAASNGPMANSPEERPSFTRRRGRFGGPPCMAPQRELTDLLLPPSKSSKHYL